MNPRLTLSVGILILGLVFALHAKADKIVIAWSPHHRYCCELRSSDNSGEIVSFKSSTVGEAKLLLSTPRWAEVHWSPHDAWFCIDDEWDPDSNRLHLYHVNRDGTTEQIWSSLDAAPDSYWKVLGWRMDKGIIRVEVNYAKDYNKSSKGWITQAYMIPIFLPNQVTSEQAYLQAVKNQQRQPSRGQQLK